MAPPFRGLLVASALVGSLGWSWGPTPAAAEIPARIRSYQVGSVRGTRSADADGRTHITVRTSTRSFDFELETSPILAPGARTFVVDGSGTPLQPRESQVYRGHLADDPEADVRVALSGRALVGSVSQGDETWYFEPLRVYEPSAAPDQALVYRAGDLDASTSPPGACGIDDSAPPAAMKRHDSAALVPGSTAAEGARSRIVELTVVADSLFFETHGADSAAYMQTIIDRIDSFYRREVGVVLQVVQTVVYTNPGAEPFFPTTNAASLLFFLGSARTQQPEVLGAGDLTHLFTGRNLDGSTIGMAYVGGLCEASRGCGLSQNFSSDLHDMTLVAGHEIGHNLGAIHDGQSGSPCADERDGYVMWAQFGDMQRESFSLCSRNSIEPVVAAASCVSLSPCGDGDLDPDEACDDGANLDGDCCDSNCRFEGRGSRCPDDGNTCTLEYCGEAGECVHAIITEGSCYDDDICSIGEQCVNGVCTSFGDLRPLDRSLVAATFGSGVGDDTLVLKSSFSSGSLNSPPTSGGATLRFLDETGMVLHESSIDASSWVDLTGRGASYEYRAAGAAAPEAGGALWMRIDYRTRVKGAARSKIRARFGDTELAGLAGRNVLGLEIILGNTEEGACGTATALACTNSPTQLLCR